MDKEGWFQLGYITKVHALRGEVILVLDVDFPEDYEGLEHVFVAKDSRFIPYFLEHFILQPNKKGLAKFEGIGTKAYYQKVNKITCNCKFERYNSPTHVF